MSNPIKLLSRLFRKNPTNVVVSELYSKMSQPLFVHPKMGEMVMKAYLSQVNSDVGFLRGETDQTSVAVTRHNDFAVIDISGALTAREESVPCSAPPASYEVIKQDMSDLLADDSIKTIIGRFDSPGGMASQNMDLSDFIYSSRGQGTRMIAMVDDMAYSAAFGIASAFDEIWVTRTSGVGSVGVVSYHIDQSEANSKAGIKIEYIYAGDKKVLGNPHEELSEEGRKEYQAEVNRLYNIFTATVARNLNLSVEQVRATEAGTFNGEDAIEAGFAHTVGTFDDLLLSLMKEQKSSSTTLQEGNELEANADVEKQTTEQIIDKIEEASKLDTEGSEGFESNVDLIVDQEYVDDHAKQENDGVPGDAEENSPELNQDDQSEKEADLAAEKAKQEAEKLQELDGRNAGIKALCEAANVTSSAENFIKSSMTLDQVRSDLLSLTSTRESNAIVNSKSVALTTEKSSKDSWADAFEKVNK